MYWMYGSGPQKMISCNLQINNAAFDIDNAYLELEMMNMLGLN